MQKTATLTNRGVLASRTSWASWMTAALFAGALLLGLAGNARAQGVTADKIVLGQSVALSGPAQDLGTEMREGALAYFNSINEKGGVNGRKIELITLDDGYEPDRAKANTQKFVADGVFALFGYVGTPTSNASMPVFNEAKVPFIGAFTGAESLRTPVNKLIFNVRASYFDETELIVEHITSFGLKNIAIFYQNDAYGKAGLAGVERAMKKRNLTISMQGTVERNTVDVGAAVKSLAAVKPDAVVMISAYKSCAAFIKEFKKTGVPTQFYNVSFVGSYSLARELGKDGYGVLISQVMPTPSDRSQPLVAEYQDAMKKHFPKSKVGFGSLEGYTAAKVTVAGLERAGKALTRENFIAAMETVKQQDFGGFFVSYGAARRAGSTWTELTLIGKDEETFIH